MDRIAIGSSVQHHPTDPLQDFHVSIINAFLAPIRKAHASNPVPSVRPIRPADRGHSSADGALEFLRKRLARREEEFVALDEG